jgi:cytochrome P450
MPTWEQELEAGGIGAIDPFSDGVLLQPYPYYARLREAAPAAYVEQHRIWVMGRYADVRAALTDWKTFSSADGVFVADETNMPGFNAITNDPPLHTLLRAVLNRHLSPHALRSLGTQIAAQADELVENLVAQRTFDAVSDLARAFALSVVADLVGLPQDGREHLLRWSDALFNAQGPMNERTVAALPAVQEAMGYLQYLADPGRLAPGSWGAAIFEAGERGEIDPQWCIPSMGSLVIPAMDTTLNALASALWLFAEHPEQWDAVRDDRSLIPGAFAEVLRLETPISGFARTVRESQEMDGVTVPAGARVFLIYASANRDERRWEHADMFDVRRNASGHLAFGWGVHGCVGQGLARLEVHAMFDALARRVERFELHGATRHLNNTLRGFKSLPMTVHRS